eukprot:UN09350
MIKNNKKPIKNNTKPIKNYTNAKGKDKVRMKKQSVSRDSDSDISMLSVVDNAFNTTFTKKQLIKAHRKHIDEFMILIKEDMQLLKGFDKDEFTNNEYQKRLRDVLDRQVSAVKRYNSKYLIIDCIRSGTFICCVYLNYTSVLGGVVIL